MWTTYWFPSFALGCLLVFLQACTPPIPEEVAVAYKDLPEKIDFNFHVKPLLSDRCYHCHGPDEAARQADLRLDLEEEAFAKLASGSGYALVAGNISKSKLVQRILTDDPETLMPPPESHLSLTEQEKAILIKWIEQGAEWKNHWAFTTPDQPVIPEVRPPYPTPANPIDNFAFAKLAQEGLTPSDPASKERLLRRVSMDLTGLPPTIQEIEAFLADDNPEAYEKVVDGLLDSPAAAERLAMDWMDLARYADSHGMHADGWRMMWPWRDWVIRAFQENMPYDQFVLEQLAGDMLPDASRDQKLATAFNRNHPMTAEGGVIDEEFRLSYVFDRSETVATAFLGLTLNCARCHDHKFDPLSQKEYYEFTAFFNNVKELGMTGDDGNYGPMVSVADTETEEKIQQIKALIQKEEKKLLHTQQEVAQTASFVKKLPKHLNGRVGYYPLESARKVRPGDKSRGWEGNIAGHFLADGNPKAFSRKMHESTEGKIGNAWEFDGDYDALYLKDVGLIEVYEPFSAGLWLNTTKKEKGKSQSLLCTAGDKNNFWRGWDFYLDTLNRLNARLIHSFPHNYIHIRSEEEISTNTWKHAAFTYSGSGKATGLELYIDGKKAKTEVIFDQLYKTIYPVSVGEHTKEDRPIRVGLSYRNYTGEAGIFKGKLDDIQLFNRQLSEIEVAFMTGEWNPEQAPPTEEQMKAYHLLNHPTINAERKSLQKVQEEQLALLNGIPEVMVMEELTKPRTTYAYSRGAYDSPMYEVQAATPSFIFSLPEDLPKNRLGLAKWLFHEENPLTARVTVNRYWQMIFGRGLVKTPQDFGVQGALPTHPALLDWLSISFRESGWDVKALLKTMVMSYTYRQDSETDAPLRNRDPENLLLARGPSYRLPAEMIRDNALAASGLLVQEVGGESVRPYQPEGLWIEKGNFSHRLLRYQETKGDSLYRRSLYTFVRRTSPHPAMTAFDAPNRDVCTIKRENTNTPLQALVLLNDPQFVEAARVMAERMQLEGGENLEAQIDYAFMRTTGRKVRPAEMKLFKELFQQQLKGFQENPRQAEALLAVGEYPTVNKLNTAHTAALAMLTSTMFNHDEAYIKR